MNSSKGSVTWRLVKRQVYMIGAKIHKYFILKDKHIWIFIDKIVIIQLLICVNFKILGANENERTKGEWTR